MKKRRKVKKMKNQETERQKNRYQKDTKQIPERQQDCNTELQKDRMTHRNT